MKNKNPKDGGVYFYFGTHSTKISSHCGPERDRCRLLFGDYFPYLEAMDFCYYKELHTLLARIPFSEHFCFSASASSITQSSISFIHLFSYHACVLTKRLTMK